MNIDGTLTCAVPLDSLVTSCELFMTVSWSTNMQPSILTQKCADILCFGVPRGRLQSRWFLSSVHTRQRLSCITKFDTILMQCFKSFKVVITRNSKIVSFFFFLSTTLSPSPHMKKSALQMNIQMQN